MPSKYAAQITPALLRNDRRQKSPYGQVQHERLPGDRWRVDIGWTLLHDDDRREVERWLAEAEPADVYTTAEVLHRHDASAVGFRELLPNPDFVDGTTGWSAVDATISAGVRRLRINNADGVNVARAEETVSLVTGRRYAFLAHSMAGSHALFRMDFRDDVAGSNLVTFNSATEGLLVVAALTANTGNHTVRLISRVAAAGNHLFYSGASLSRCAAVDGANQIGRAVKIKGLDASVNGVLKAGEFVSFLTDLAIGNGKANPKMELKRLTADLNSDGTGLGWLHFEPPMRSTAMLDNAVVIFHRPKFYAFFPESPLAMNYSKAVFADLSVTLEEDILAP